MSGPKDFVWPTDTLDFQGADLSGYSFRNLTIDAARTPVIFHRADLRGTRFEHSRLSGVDLSRSDFVDSIIEDTALESCKLDHFGMQSTTIRRSRFMGCEGAAAEFSDSRFDSTTFKGGSFTGGTFLGCVFEEGEFDGVGLERTTIENNHFYRTKFTDLDLGNQSVLHCTFSACTFDRVTLDVDILSTCTGFSMEDIRHLSFSRRGRRLEQPLTQIIRELYERHDSRREIVEACTISVLANQGDWFEESIQKLHVMLDPEAGARTLQLVRLARKLLYWHAEGKIETYWIAWACNAIVDRVRDPHDPIAPDHHVLEAITLLMPVAEEFARASVLTIAHDLSGRRLLDRVDVEITVDGDWTAEEGLQLLSDLNDFASPRVPRVLQVPGGVMQFEFGRARAGSIVLEGTMVLAGLAFLKIFLQQSRALVNEAGLLFASIGSAGEDWHRMRARLRGTDRTPNASAPSDSPTLSPAGAPAGALAAAPSSRSVEAAANQEFLVNVATRTVVAPRHRRLIAKHVIRLGIVGAKLNDEERAFRP